MRVDLKKLPEGVSSTEVKQWADELVDKLTEILGEIGTENFDQETIDKLRRIN